MQFPENKFTQCYLPLFCIMNDTPEFKPRSDTPDFYVYIILLFCQLPK
jgi:hypothetical protein